MKNLPVILLFSLLASCTASKQIGSINMISNRNIESNAEYVLIRNYMGASKQEIRKSKAQTVEDAVDQVVRSVPGGEFLKNVKIYLTSNKYLAVEGDVWGITGDINFRGFKIGDRVKWTKLLKNYTGVIIDLKNDKVCTIRTDPDQSIVEIEYEQLTRIGR